MARTRLRAVTTADQGEMIPPRMDLVAEWDTPESVDFELWVDSEVGDGIILAVTDGPAEIAADVLVVGEQMGATWRGNITERPGPWLNAQRVRAAFLYFADCA